MFLTSQFFICFLTKRKPKEEQHLFVERMLEKYKWLNSYKLYYY